MRILLVHNYYGSTAPSGENKVFEAERAMLERHGEIVKVFTRQSDEIRGKGLWGLLKGALCTIGNPFAARELSRKIREFKPGVVHFHNTFPLISPLAIRAASKFAPVVLTLHNYRTVCASGIPMRDGKVCTLCLDKRCAWDGIKYRCYRGSLLATLPLAINITIYRKLLSKWVTKFIALTEFQKQRMEASGFPKEKIVVKPNFVEMSNKGVLLKKDRKDQVLFVGRLSPEKGVHTLIKAWKIVENELNIDGGGGKCSILWIAKSGCR